MTRIRVLLGAAAVAFVATSAATPMAPPKLTGTVGPGFTITLKRLARPLVSLKAGRYSITVSYKSNIHNFHLRGPGVNRQITTVGFVGTKTITLKLKKGVYRFVCDPHRTTMKGSFRVV